MFDDHDSPFLTIEEAADLLRVKPRTLNNLRWRGVGPPPRRHGGRVVYHRNEVLDWSERRGTVTPKGTGMPSPPPPGDRGSEPPGAGDPEPPVPPAKRKP
jgi:hypothetical protein